jgi:hypothetical protein
MIPILCVIHTGNTTIQDSLSANLDFQWKEKRSVRIKLKNNDPEFLYQITNFISSMPQISKATTHE